MPICIRLKKYNGKKIDLADEITRYFLSMEDKDFQAKWMSRFPVTTGHDRQNISFEFDCASDSIFLYYFADNVEFDNPFIIESKAKHIDDVGIFIPGQTYYWKVVDKLTGEESEVDYFNTLNVPVRWISSGAVYNMRDIGGWKTLDHKKVRYGLIYRGAQLSLDNKWERSYMNDYSYKVFDYLNINTEVELRGGFDHKLSQIHDYTKNIYINGIGYENILAMDENQKAQYRELFSALSDRKNLPLYFHCSWGADRTGTLAFLILGVLGVSYENICEDYELTSFTGSGKRSRIDFPWKDMIPELNQRYGNKATLKELINEYLLDYVKVKQEEIDKIRSIMLIDNNDNEVVHKVAYRIDGEKYLTSLVYDGYQISNIEPGFYLNRRLQYWMIDNKRYDIRKPIYHDLVLDAKFKEIEFEKYDKLSLLDIGLSKSYDLKEAKDFPYISKYKNGSRMFSFNYKVTAFDNNFDDGVHIEIGTLWDYKAHVWLHNLDFIHVYTNEDYIPLAFKSRFVYGKTYRIDVGVLILKNGKDKGKKMLVLKIDNELIAMLETKADLSVYSIGIAGTKGILYNIEK